MIPALLESYANSFKPPHSSQHEQAAQLVRDLHGAGGIRHLNIERDQRILLVSLLHAASQSASLAQDYALERDLLIIALQCGPLTEDCRDRLTLLFAHAADPSPLAQSLYVEFLMRHKGEASDRTRAVSAAWKRITQPSLLANALARRAGIS